MAGNIDATHYMGMLAYQRGNLDAAMRLLGDAARARPDDPAILANLGLLFRATGHPDHAERVLARSVELRPQQSEAWLNLAQIRSAAGRMEDAMVCFHKVLEFSPGHSRARVGLGRQLAATRRFDEAATILEEGLTLDPNDPELQLELAQSRELAGESQEAAELYRAVAERTHARRVRSSGTVLAALGAPVVRVSSSKLPLRPWVVITMFGSITGPIVAGVLADQTDSYELGFTILAVLAGMGLHGQGGIVE